MTEEKPCCSPETQDRKNSEPCCAPTAGQSSASSCCPPGEGSPSDGCSPSPLVEMAGYRIEPFVRGWLATDIGNIPLVERKLSLADQRGRWAMRWGIGRDHYRVTPGLYAIGTPDENSEILVSANYKLSFDLLRSSLDTLSAWILVLDTRGVNVWCAAGKGTFGTDEIINRVKMTRLQDLVAHRRLILPQLGAPGIAAHLVAKGCGFKVCYGPIRAKDIPAFLSAGRQATAAMRRVSFNLRERAILTPVELTVLRRQIFYTAIGLLILGNIGHHFFNLSVALARGGGAILAGVTGLLAGAVITPILLPWLPGRAFALKGVWPGLTLGFLLGASLFRGSSHLNQTALLLQVTAISSFCAMNFTGSSTYTSPSGVEKEMRLAIPAQLAAVVLALVLWLWAAF